MTLASATQLSNRSLFRLSGADRHSFLQGIVSNDVARAREGVYAALLTPQGKFLHDMFVLEHEDAFLIECESARAEDLIDRLAAYKLRSKVIFENKAAAFDVWALWGNPYKAPLAFCDPRLPELGTRVFTEKGKPPTNAKIADYREYDLHRIELSVADGSRDLEIGHSTLAEGNLDYLNGIDWKKGCYIGQELTARLHYRGLVKKRLFYVRIEGEILPSGTPLSNEMGKMRSSQGSHGLALLKIDVVQQALDQKTPLTHGDTKLWPVQAPWMKIDVEPVNR